MFFKNATARPCIVLSVEPRPLQQLPEESPTITIVLITGFDGKALNEVMAEDDFKRIMPIRPTLAHLKAAAPIATTPEWIPHDKRRTPSYVLCIPIKVYAQNLRRFDEPVRLDHQNLEKLKVHILSLGGIVANADFVESDDDDEDDDEEVICEAAMNQVVGWDEIAV